MVNFVKNYSRNSLWDLLIKNIHIMYVSWTKPCMTSSQPLMPSSLSFKQHSSIGDSLAHVLITPCSTCIHLPLLLLIYVDDILVIGNNPTQVYLFMQYIKTTFAIWDLGHINYFLGIEVIHDNGTLHLNQEKYIYDLLTWTSMINSKLATTLGVFNKTLSQSNGEPFPNASLYHNIVGALKYVTITRHDLTSHLLGTKHVNSWLIPSPCTSLLLKELSNILKA